MTPRKRECPPDARLAVIVEGGDEERVVKRLLTAPAFLVCAGGQAGVRRAVESAAKDPGWSRIRGLAILLDAEEDSASAFERACEAMSGVAWPVPGEPEQVAAAGDQVCGVFVLPGQGAPGASEALLLQTASASELACIEAWYDCVGRPGTTVARRDKARAHALSAGRGLGRPDVIWDDVDLTHDAIAPLATFFRNLEAAVSAL